MHYTFLTCDLTSIAMCCCLEAGIWVCISSSNRRYVLLFWEKLVSPPGKCRPELPYTGQNFSPPNIKCTDTKVWVGSLLNRISQWYTMIWPDQTILFVEDPSLPGWDAVSWARGSQHFENTLVFKGVHLGLHTSEYEVISSFEMFRTTFQATLHHNLKDMKPQLRTCENLKTHITLFVIYILLWLKITSTFCMWKIKYI